MAVRVGGIEFAIKVSTSSAVQAVRAFQGSVSKAGNAAAQASRGAKQFAKAVTAAGVAITGMALAVGKLSDSFLGIAKDSTLLAARVQVLGTVFQQVGQNVGFTSGQLNAVELSVRKLGITTQSARKSLTQLLQANLDLTKATRLTRIAQDAAVIAGVDSSEAFNRLVVSIQRNDVRLLRNLGIVINLNTVYQKFAQQTGRTVNTLTAFEKRQLLLNEVLERGNDIAGTYEAALGDVFKRFTSLNRKVEEAARAFGNNFIPIFEKVVDGTDKLLTQFTDGDLAGEYQALAVKVLAASAAFTAAAGAIGTLVAGLGALKLASVAAVAAGTTLTATLGPVVLAVAAAGAAAAFFANEVGNVAFDAAQAGIFARELEDAAKEGDKLGAELAQLRESLSVFDNLSDDAELSANQMKILREEVEKVAAALPDIGFALRQAAAEGDVDKLIELVQRAQPRADTNEIKTITKLRQDQAVAVQSAANALRELGLTQQEIDARIKFSIKSGKGLNDIFSRAPEAVEGVTDALTTLNRVAFLENRAATEEAGKSLRKAQQEYAKARKAISSFGDGIESLEFQKLNTQVDAVVRAGDQTAKALGQLQTAQKSFFSDNERRLLRYLELQTKVTTESVSSADAIRRQTELAISASTRQIQEQTEALLVDAGTAEKRAEIRAKAEERIFNATQAALAKQEDALASLTKQQEFFNKVAKFGAEQVEEGNKALDARAQRLKFLEAGVSPEVLRLRERAAASEREALTSIDNLREGLAATRKRRAMELTRLDEEVLAGRISAEEAASSLLIKNLEDQIAKQSAILKQAQQRQVLEQKRFQIQIERARQKESDSLIKQEEDLLNERAELQNKVNLNSLDAVKRAADEQKRALEETEGFIERLSLNLRDKATPGVASVQNAVEDFTDALAKAQSPGQVAQLKELFPKEIKARIEEATKSLEGAREAFRKFQEETRPGKERDQRIARQKRFNELIDAGVPVAVALQEREKARLADAEKLNTEEEKLKAAKTEQERIARELKMQQEAVTKEVQKQADVRRTALERETNFINRQLELEKQRTAEIDVQLSKLDERRRLRAEAYGTAIEPRAFVPTAPTPQAVQETAQSGQSFPGLTTELTGAISEASFQDKRRIGAQKELTSAMIQYVRDAAKDAENGANAITEVLNSIEQIRRDKRVGDQVMGGSKRF